ncbi:MAG: hypothetical protein AMK73_09880, partial [Planctomycetes bacterium SM23_32]
ALVPDADVLDLYCGSGALGLEAISRGARSCTFVEQDARLGRLAMDNAERCRLAGRCRLVQADVLSLPSREPPDPARPAGLVFVDPPYADVDDANRRAALFAALGALAGSWAADGALLMLHHRPMPYVIWPAGRLARQEARVYGKSQLTFFSVAAGDDDG